MQVTDFIDYITLSFGKYRVMIAAALGIWSVVRQIIDIMEMLGLLLWFILYATWSRILVKDKSAVSTVKPLT